MSHCSHCEPGCVGGTHTFIHDTTWGEMGRHENVEGAVTWDNGYCPRCDTHQGASGELGGEDDEARLARLASLTQGWYGKGQGEPIPAEVLDETRNLLGPLRALGVGKPLIYPMLDGGLQVKWSHCGITREVTVGPDSAIRMCEYGETTHIAVESSAATVEQFVEFFEEENKMASRKTCTFTCREVV